MVRPAAEVAKTLVWVVAGVGAAYVLNRGIHKYLGAQKAFAEIQKTLPTRQWSEVARFSAQNYRLGNVKDFVPVHIVNGKVPDLPPLVPGHITFQAWWTATPEKFKMLVETFAKKAGLSTSEALRQISTGDLPSYIPPVAIVPPWVNVPTTALGLTGVVMTATVVEGFITIASEE